MAKGVAWLCVCVSRCMCSFFFVVYTWLKEVWVFQSALLLEEAAGMPLA